MQSILDEVEEKVTFFETVKMPIYFVKKRICRKKDEFKECCNTGVHYIETVSSWITMDAEVGKGNCDFMRFTVNCRMGYRRLHLFWFWILVQV